MKDGVEHLAQGEAAGGFNLDDFLLEARASPFGQGLQVALLSRLS